MAAAALSALLACSPSPGSTPPTPASPTASATESGISVPSVVGLTYKEARSELRSAGFTVRRTNRTSTSSDPGTVISQSLTPFSVAEVGDQVALVVATAKKVAVPNLVGDALAGAKASLRSKGFEVKVVRKASDAAPGTVLSQSVRAGAKSVFGTLVTLTVAKSKPPSPPPPPTCTPGYDPCLPPASDYDCSGGEGNGPAYTEPRITYRVSGSDPYGLDADGDGLGCE